MVTEETPASQYRPESGNDSDTTLDTDLQRLKKLLGSWMVPFCMDWDDERVSIIVGSTMDYRNPSSARVGGYPGFYTQFDFAKGSGSFTQMGAWE